MKFPLMRNNILREDLDAVIAHLQQDDPILTHHANVRAFEEEWSRWLSVNYSVFVNSGSSANLLTLTVLKNRYPQGGEVIVPTLTWVSDIASVLQTGFTPVFVDLDPRTLAMDANEVIAKLGPDTRGVFLTHAQGFDGLTDPLLGELERRGIPLIEDVCESHGATHNGIKAGTFGWISNFSFYYAHHMSTIEGGMVCTDDPEVYQQARMLRSHGMVRESDDQALRERYAAAHTELHPTSSSPIRPTTCAIPRSAASLGAANSSAWITSWRGAPRIWNASWRALMRGDTAPTSDSKAPATTPST